MRGKVIQMTGGYDYMRITPAHAGKRGEIKCIRFPDRDHPRACGEKSIKASFALDFVGSPPRMRGKVQTVLAVYVGVGITPAHAGKRHRQRGGDASGQDHPRACGEKAEFTAPEPELLGSPPRMRGKE